MLLLFIFKLVALNQAPFYMQQLPHWELRELRGHMLLLHVLGLFSIACVQVYLNKTVRYVADMFAARFNPQLVNSIPGDVW